ncbi:MAG: CoA transferase [Alphaproteobacteria bacterium]|nr:CoA transferase [Alphaproteobacteria bacterium]
MTTARPYSGVRILDLTRELGGYATRLFADLGAEVVRVEPPEGASDRRRPPPLPGLNSDVPGGAPVAFLAANKASVTLDLGEEAGLATFAALARTAQILAIEPGPDQPDVTAEALAANPALVVAIFSHFGLGGPHSGWLGSDLVTQAAGGLAWLSGTPDEAPLRVAGEQTPMVASLYGAVAMGIALWDAELRGRGHVIDVSAQECIAHSLQNAVQVYDLEKRISRRGGEGTRDCSEDMFRCKDGWVFLAAPPTLGISWRQLVAWMAEAGHPEASRLGEPKWLDRPWRNTAPAKAEFRAIFESFLADRTQLDLTEEALRRKVVLSPVARISETVKDPQLVYRNYFVEVPHPALGRNLTFPGAPFRLSRPVWHIDRPAPAVGQDNDRILAGL